MRIQSLNLALSSDQNINRINDSIEYPEYQYYQVAEDIIQFGSIVKNRTGVDAYTIPHAVMSFNLEFGFPLFTHKKIAWKVLKVELEGFIKSVSSKKWYQDRGCHIWDEWCNPQKVPYANDDITKNKMKMEDDLGPIYGCQWRNFNDQGVDQLAIIVDLIKKDPNNRRLVCSAWNPVEIFSNASMALPPCHFNFVLSSINDTLHLSYEMRSVDWGLGVPFNTASYALLLHLICLETNKKPGCVTGFFNNVHIYVNHLEAFKEILKRKPYKFPGIKTENFSGLFNWQHNDTVVVNYQSHGPVSMEIAI